MTIDYSKVRAVLMSDGNWHAGCAVGIEVFDHDGQPWWAMRAHKVGTQQEVTVTGPMANVLAFELTD